MKKLKTAILGGTFNPPHIAHINIAKYVCSQLSYQRIIFVPSYISPHKEPINNISIEDRYNMTALAIKDYNQFYIEDYEINQKSVSYTINTIEHIYKTYEDIEDRLALIIGSDLIADFDKWSKSKDIADKVDIIAISRTNADKIEDINIEKYKMKLLYIDYMNISSTIIREKIYSDDDITKNMLDQKVYDYIKEHNLYNQN